ncbi:MAG TPA: FeoC-like transcriptional regulator [Chitinolyticbacter sp.]|nr:FeoC-like transcriptional regulator [Chitinolyticbacter sp.]
MGLLELKKYLQGRGTIAAAQVALHFGVEVSAVERMAEDWAGRGKLQLAHTGSGCAGKSCQGCCAQAPSTLLRWLD